MKTKSILKLTPAKGVTGTNGKPSVATKCGCAKPESPVEFSRLDIFLNGVRQGVLIAQVSKSPFRSFIEGYVELDTAIAGLAAKNGRATTVEERDVALCRIATIAARLSVDVVMPEFSAKHGWRRQKGGAS
jgi:hypothetical protein